MPPSVDGAGRSIEPTLGAVGWAWTVEAARVTGVACVDCGFCQGAGWVAGVVAAAAWARLSSAGLEIAVKAEESLSPGVLVFAAFTCLEGKSDSETERAAKAIIVATRKRPSAARGSRFIFMGLWGMGQAAMGPARNHSISRPWAA